VATRALERSKRRMPCRVHVEGRQHNGIVLDLSGSGLFIQTSAKLPPGVHVRIDLGLPDGEAAMTVEVVRRKQVPAQLLAVAHGGIGVRILSAPEAYYRFLQDVQERERQMAVREAADSGKASPAASARAAAAKPSPAPSVQAPAAASGPRFRVRVSQTSGIRSRTVVVAAASADAASRSTQAELGDDWKVVAVEPL
jgi:hypothetical protein